MIRARDVIPTPMLELAEMLLAEPPRWLGSFLRLACMEGEETAAQLYGETVTRRESAQKQVSLDVGAPIAHADGETVVIPVRWRVQGYRILPHRFDGRFQLTPGPGTTTAIELYGNWPFDPRESPDFTTRLAARTAAEAVIGRLLINLRVAVEEAAVDTA